MDRRKQSPLTRIASALLAAGLAGCSASNAPPTAVYSLPPVSADSAQNARPLPGVLVVLRFEADSVLGARRIAWRAGPEALSIGNYANQEWSTPPPELMQYQLEHCLGDARVAETVAPASAQVSAQWVLSGRLRYFEQQLTGPKNNPNNAQVRVGADVILTARERREPAWQGLVDVTVVLPDADPALIPGGVQEALEQFCEQLARRLGEADIDRSETP